MLLEAHHGQSLFQILSGKNQVFSDIIKCNDKATCFYTGLSKYSLLVFLFDLLKSLLPEKDPYKSDISLQDEFLGFLIKLRLGVPHEDIAYRLNTSITTVKQFSKSG